MSESAQLSVGLASFFFLFFFLGVDYQRCMLSWDVTVTSIMQHHSGKGVSVSPRTYDGFKRKVREKLRESRKAELYEKVMYADTAGLTRVQVFVWLSLCILFITLQ